MRSVDVTGLLQFGASHESGRSSISFGVIMAFMLSSNPKNICKHKTVCYKHYSQTCDFDSLSTWETYEYQNRLHEDGYNKQG